MNNNQFENNNLNYQIPVGQNKKNNRNIVYIFIFVLLIVLILGGVYYFSNQKLSPQTITEQETSNNENTKVNESTPNIDSNKANDSNEKEKYLNGIVELPTTDYDKEEANNMINRLGLFDIKLLKLIYENKGIVILCSGPITDDYRFSYLKGSAPRGWEGTGYTWDDVPGAGDYPYTIARIGKSFPSYENNHGSMVLELHETSHMIDAILNDLSLSPEFTELMEEESDILFPDDVYYDMQEEYWAESLSYFTYTDYSRNTLKTYAPKTYDYFVNLINSLE